MKIYSEGEVQAAVNELLGPKGSDKINLVAKERRIRINRRLKEFSRLFMAGAGGEDRELVSYFIERRSEGHGGKLGYNFSLIRFIASAVIAEKVEREGKEVTVFKEAPHFAFVMSFVRAHMTCAQQVNEEKTGNVDIMNVIETAVKNKAFKAEKRLFDASEVLALFAAGKLTKVTDYSRKEGDAIVTYSGLKALNLDDVRTLDVKVGMKALADKAAKFGDVIPYKK